MYSDTTGGKNTVWALYLRAMLLWNGCVRMRNDTGISDYFRRDFAMRAWIETEAIEKALQLHTCRSEGSFMYHGREILFKYVRPSPNCTRLGRHRHKTDSEPITAPGCASHTNFGDSFLRCKFLSLKYESSVVLI
jgi:hypothetical protein